MKTKTLYIHDVGFNIGGDIDGYNIGVDVDVVVYDVGADNVVGISV